ncbi:hypothetical protein MPSEU_000832100 [Mayamaea pseudoterrestris]|nr:hypothetical protein MPSEU_000832100 [Mayamaea pseudoterrestris]
MFRRADAFFAKHGSSKNNTTFTLKRPSLVVYVQRDPDAPAPPPLPEYLLDLPDPSASPTMTMLSFYSFPPTGIHNPEEFARLLKSLWKPFSALGRIYVAPEGVNAQMSVPTNVLERFIECCHSIPELGEYMENGINIDPVAISREEFFNDSEQPPPFTNLHVRVRSKIVADGLDKAYEWQQAGYDMPPLEWHETLKQARELKRQGHEEQAPIVLDFRNVYETDVGRFDGAEPLGTTNFRESWDVVNERLASVDKSTPILMYCTGGIRCVKAGAYVTQELGFTNVSRLAGGIIAYDRILREKAEDEESMFKGTNFVFDNRLGRQITDDALGTCLTCGGETALVSNCRNENCHKRMVQCEQCRTNMRGTCSDACQNRVINGEMRPLRAPRFSAYDVGTEAPVVYTNLDQYSLGHSTPPSSIYNEMELNTRALIPSGSHMVSGAAQGRLLTQLSSMTREGRILELGTFTGYATVCLLEGAMNVGNLLDSSSGSRGLRESGPYVLTMERDTVAFNVAAAHLKVIAEHGLGDSAAENMCQYRASGMPSLPSEPLVTLDCQGIATCELMQVSDALATIEEMAAGKGDILPGPFDLIFVDADKTRLLDYAEACLSSDRLLKKGGLLVVDNVLWKGLVLEASTGNFSSLRETDETGEDELRKNRRARKLAMKMHRFNSAIVQDTRAEVLVLPMRDGLSVIRKK